jgi:hypothetical protein
MDFLLRRVEAEDVPEVQRLYEAEPEVFQRLLGRPAPPDQAINDYVQALGMPGRFQFAVLLDGRMVGLADCKLDDEVEGLAHLGLLLLARPYADAAVTALVLRILARWLESLGVRKLQISVPAHVREEVAFWQALGFGFTGEQYRRDLPGYAPRFLVMERAIHLATS